MSHTLARLLGETEPHFSQKIRELELATGRQGYDVRLIDSLAKIGHQATEQLRLDVDDTTPKELYYALIDRVLNDSNTLAAHLGIEPSDKPELMLRKLINWINKQDISSDLWVIKSSVMRSLLKKQPPKQLMKALGLRSIDSVLKRNDPSELIALASLVEKHDWLEKFKSQYKKIKPSDFNTLKADIRVIKAEQVDKLRAKGLTTTRLVNPCYETGIVVVLCPQERFRADVLTLATTIIDCIRHMRRYSAYFRSLSPVAKFGTNLAEVCTNGINNASRRRAGIHWDPIHSYLVGNREYVNEVGQPHLSHEDLFTDSPSRILASLDPRFAFWEDREHAIFYTKPVGMVSLNIIDVSINASNQSSFEQSSSHYAINHLSNKLWGPYLEHDNVSNKFLSSFFGEEQL